MTWISNTMFTWLVVWVVMVDVGGIGWYRWYWLVWVVWFEMGDYGSCRWYWLVWMVWVGMGGIVWVALLGWCRVSIDVIN